jgi:hypothetical protein
MRRPSSCAASPDVISMAVSRRGRTAASTPASRKPNRRPRRSGSVYKFVLRDPWGTNAIYGYRRAARHFGLKTLEDPSLEGTDQWRLLVHKDAGLLRRTGKRLVEHNIATSERDDDYVLVEEMDILLKSGVHWFAQDCNWWDIENDEGALESLGWARTVTEPQKGTYQVVLRQRPKTRKRRRGRKK